MTVLMVPDDDEVPWPTLGKGVCDFIEANLVFGPGDLLGQPARLDQEKRALIYRMYEVYPQGATDDNGKDIGGRRRFRRCCVSLQKGSAKTELAAWIAAVELHPLGPVRFKEWNAKGNPVGRAVNSPYIPMVAYTEGQVEDLAYGVLKTVLEKSRIAHDFDIGFERITRIDGSGKVQALAGAPDSRDGALTTFAHKDETHRWTLQRLRKAHFTMLANLTKRMMSEPWELETTTAYAPGEGSVAEDTAAYAQSVLEGVRGDSRLFYFHRQAADGYDWNDPDQRRVALAEAAGPTAEWKDMQGISEHWQDPRADRTYLERVFGNRPVATANQAFDAAAWQRNKDTEYRVPRHAPITLGFDGSLREDSTALIATEVSSGMQWPLAVWEKPQHGEWSVPRKDVDAAVDLAFEEYEVLLMYCDPSKFESWVAKWEGKYGKRVVSWPTTLYRKYATALKAYAGAIASGEVRNDGHLGFARHIGAAQRNMQLQMRDDDDSPLWLIQKDRPGSPNKIDMAAAGCLSWAARNKAISDGALEQQETGISVYVQVKA